MQGRKCLFLFLLAILAGCSGKSLLQADCHSCTVEEQEWSDFSWAALMGTWKGSMELSKNELGKAKRTKEEQGAELKFLSAENFFAAKPGITCTALPSQAL